VIEGRYFTGKELAELFRVHPETIRRAAASGELKSIRVGAERRYPESAVEEWVTGERPQLRGRVVSLDRRVASG
jgi:excisionase family DNA binding protein